mgnify:CR=1 FL=1
MYDAGFITNSQNDQLPVGLIAQLVELYTLHRYPRGQGFDSLSSLDFFQAFVRYCSSSVNNCDELKIIT